MKKIFQVIILCICTFALSACKNTAQADYGNEYIYEQDSQNFSVGVREGAYTENGFYAINTDSENIDFIDSKTQTAVPVCGKPNCKHNDELCNAHFNTPESVMVYNGYLYIIAHGKEMSTVYLYKMSLDGSERIELRTLYSFEEEDANTSLFFMIHRGYGYMVINWRENFSRKEREQMFYRIPLNDSEERIELYKIKGYSPQILIYQSEGNKIYFCTKMYEDDTFTDMKEQTLCLNIVTDTITEINIPEGYYIAAVKDEIIYTVKDNETYSELYCMNANDDNLSKVYEWSCNEPIIYRDEKYIYLDNEFYLMKNNFPDSERVITVIDYEGNHVFDINNLGYKGVRWSDSEQLLIRDSQNEEYSLFDLSTQEEMSVKKNKKVE